MLGRSRGRSEWSPGPPRAGTPCHLPERCLEEVSSSPASTVPTRDSEDVRGALSGVPPRHPIIWTRGQLNSSPWVIDRTQERQTFQAGWGLSAHAQPNPLPSCSFPPMTLYCALWEPLRAPPRTSLPWGKSPCMSERNPVPPCPPSLRGRSSQSFGLTEV